MTIFVNCYTDTGTPIFTYYITKYTSQMTKVLVNSKRISSVT